MNFTGLGNVENSLSGVTINEYNGLNQLVQVTKNDTVSEYTYNADGLRNSKTVNGLTQTHIGDGSVLIAEHNQGADQTNFYLSGNGLVASYNGSTGEELFYQTNLHGDLDALIKADGSVKKRYTYDAFGVEQNIDPADSNPFRYCSEYFDKETGDIYLRARYYDSADGRFQSEDTYQGKTDQAMSLNLYGYCDGDPVNLVDPTGNSSTNTMDKGAVGGPAGGSSQYNITGGTEAGAAGGARVSAKIKPTAPTVSRGNSGAKYTAPKANVEAAKATTSNNNGGTGRGKSPGSTVDPNTGSEVGRFISDGKGNVMIEPVGGKTVPAGKNKIDTHTTYPNGSNYQRLNPKGHANNSTPHGHGHFEGTGPGIKGQGPSMNANGVQVPWSSAGAHWPIY